jgi:hypothetical protein
MWDAREKKKKHTTKMATLKLLRVSPSPKKNKKYRAFFSDGSHTDFGAAGYSDFTIHKDVTRKNRYIARHESREHWKDLTTPGALSRYILWNKPSLQNSIKNYRTMLKKNPIYF